MFPSSTILSLALLAIAGVGLSAEPDGFDISATHAEATETEAGRVIHLEDEVTITRGGATLIGDHGRYYEANRTAIIFGNVHGVDGTASTSCDTLRYLRDSDTAYLLGNASYSDTSGMIDARRIELLRSIDMAVASGEVVVSASDGSSELRAGLVVYDIERREVRASRGPELSWIGEQGETEGRLTAAVIDIHPDEDLIRAMGDATLEREGVTAVARIATLFGEDDSIELLGDPIVRRETDRLSGESVLIEGEDGDISRVLALGSARVDYELETEEGETPESGHVRGDTLEMFFSEGEAVRTSVRGASASEHLVGDAGERNFIESASVDVAFRDGRITRATFRGGAVGAYDFYEEAEGETTGLETVVYGAEQIDYYVERNRIALSRDSRVEYKNTVLTAERVEFDPENQTLSAEGEPDLREKSDRLVGGEIRYDMERQAGLVREGLTTFEDGLYYGDSIVREGDGTLRVNGGTYTTCSNEKPHYRISSGRMKVYFDDKVVARPVVMYIGEMPVLALPFYVFPIKKDRHSGFLIPQLEIGLSENKGRFVKNFGYYWAPNDYCDFTAWADYYEQSKWIAHLETRYKLRYVLSGSVDASFMEEMLYNKRRWDLGFEHMQELGRNWTLSAAGDFRSDATYASDANQSIQESVNRSLHSQLWLRGRWSRLSVGVTLDRREELDEGTIAELLPKVSVTASQKPLVTAGEGEGGVREWLSKVSYNWSAAAVNDRDRKGSATEVHQGLGFSGTIRTSTHLLRHINLSPRLNVRQNWYDRDKAGNRFPMRFTYDAALSAGTTLYGTFFPRLGPLDSVRHVMEPSLSYSWAPEFSQYFDEGVDRFYTMSGFGSTPGDREAVSVSLTNKLQVKLRDGEELRKIDNLLRFTMSSSYDFKKDEYRWADVISRLELRPATAVSFTWDGRHGAYGGALERSTMTATLSLTGDTPPVADTPWEDRIIGESDSPADQLRSAFAGRDGAEAAGTRPWSAAATLRYSRGADADDATYWVDGSAALSLSPKWRINYSIHYDIKEQEVASQEYAIHRDLHCWEAQFVRRYYDGEWEYYFRINVKALPDIQAETGEKHLKTTVR